MSDEYGIYPDNLDDVPDQLYHLYLHLGTHVDFE